MGRVDALAGLPRKKPQSLVELVEQEWLSMGIYDELHRSLGDFSYINDFRNSHVTISS